MTITLLVNNMSVTRELQATSITIIIQLPSLYKGIVDHQTFTITLLHQEVVVKLCFQHLHPIKVCNLRTMEVRPIDLYALLFKRADH